MVNESTNPTGAVGETVELSVEAVNATSYQWQVKKNANVNWTDVTSTAYAGRTDAVMRFMVTESNLNYLFRVIVSNDEGESLESDAVRIIEARPVLEIVEQPTDQTGNIGEMVELSVEAVNATSYQWQVKKSETSNWADVTSTAYTGRKTSVMRFSVTEANLNYMFRVIVSNDEGESLESDSVRIIEPAGQYTITYNTCNPDAVFYNGKTYYSVYRDAGLYYVDNYDVPEPWLEGHRFLYWADADGNAVKAVNLSSDIIFNAVWEHICTVTYDANGGQFDNGNTKWYDTDHSEGYYTVDCERPNQAGYVFKGWADSVTGGKISRRINLTGDTTLYAQWEEAVTVKYLANEGYWQFGEDEEAFEEVYDYQLPGTYFVGWHEPMREGYEFDGWLYGGKKVEKIKLVKGNTYELTANWKPAVARVKVYYDANGGIFEHDEDFPNDTLRYWDEEVGSYNVGCDEPYKEGFYFGGWAEKADVAYAPRIYNYTLEEGKPVTFYAIYYKDDDGNLSITYNANGGRLYWDSRFDEEKEEYYYYPVEVDERYVDYDYHYLNDWYPERDEAYEFIGWSITRNGDVKYQPDEEVFITSDLTLYAVWKARPSVTYYGNGGGWGEYDADNDTYEQLTHVEYYDAGYVKYVDKVPIPCREGYDFVGWFSNAACTGDRQDENEFEVEDGKHYSYYAKWAKTNRIVYHANGGWFDRTEDGKYVAAESDHEDHRVGRVYYVGFEAPRRYEEKTDDQEGTYIIEYEFCGWGTNPNATRADDVSGDHFTVQEGAKYDYYAIWVRKVNIDYHTNGGLFDGYDYRNNETYELHHRWECVDNTNWLDGCIPNREDVVNEGTDEEYIQKYQLMGWTTNPTPEIGPDVTVLDWDNLPELNTANFSGLTDSNTIDLYAVWAPSLIVTYDSNGGWWYGWDDYTDTDYEYYKEYQEYEYGEDGYEISNRWPQRDGYAFIGWSRDSEAVEGVYRDFVPLNGPVTYFAVWEQQVSITLDLNGGYYLWYNEETDSCDRITENDIEHYRDGERVPFSDIEDRYDIRKDNCNRIGWLVNGIPCDDDGFIAREGLVISPDWDQLYELSFDYNGGTYLANTGNSGIYFEAGKAIDLDWFDTPYKTGYVFAGWKDKNGKFVSKFVITEDSEFTAEWIELPEDDYTFYANCGSDVQLICGDSAKCYMIYPGSQRTLNYSSENRNVALVGRLDNKNAFIIMPTGAGVTTVHVTDGTLTYDIEVTVVEPLIAHVISAFRVDDTVQLKVNMPEGMDEGFYWESDDDNVVEVEWDETKEAYVARFVGTGSTDLWFNMETGANTYYHVVCMEDDDIQIDPYADLELAVGGHILLNVYYTGETRELSVDAEDGDIADIFNVQSEYRNIEIVGVSEGNATFTLTDDRGNSYTFEVHVFSEKIEKDNVTYRVTENGTLCVESYSGNLESVVIPEVVNGRTVVEIGNEAFMGKTTLTSIRIPNTVESIGARAFKNCVNLNEITDGVGICLIEEEAFSGCGNLVAFRLSDAAYSIGARAFANCYSLSEFSFNFDGVEGYLGTEYDLDDLGGVVADLADDAFEGCTLDF